MLPPIPALPMLLLSVAQAAEPVADGATPQMNAQTFRPSMDSHEFLRAVDSDLGAETVAARAVLSYTLDPLKYTAWDGTTETLVGSLVQLDAIGTITSGPVRVGIDLPVFIRSFGSREDDATGLGDLTIDGKLRILDPETSKLGLAVSGRVLAPSSTVGGALGTAGVGGGLTLSADANLGDRLDAVVSLGADFAPEVVMDQATWGTRAELQAGLAYHLSDRSGVAAEAYTAAVLADLANARSRPSELLLGGWTRLGQRGGLVIHPAVGFGLDDAITAPAFRAILTVGWDPLGPARPPDRDKDGVADAADACVDVPEDKDGYADEDGCAELATLAVKVVDTDGVAVSEASWVLGTDPGAHGQSELVPLPAGPVTVSSSGSSATPTIPAGGAVVAEIQVPAPRGMLAVEIVDKQGKPVVGALWSAKGPRDVAEQTAGSVPVRPGEYALAGRAEGYRAARAKVSVIKDGSATLRLEMVPAKAALKAEKIEIKDSVYFETAKTVIKAESFALLDEVAEVLRDHPELTKVRIEGNTDARGPAAANQKLSQGRAEAVSTYLVAKGVAAGRLQAIGNGESKPLVKEKSKADEAKNRRVDFVVAERSDGAVQAPVKMLDTPGDKPKEK